MLKNSSSSFLTQTHAVEVYFMERLLWDNEKVERHVPFLPQKPTCDKNALLTSRHNVKIENQQLWNTLLPLVLRHTRA
jgi:hypothetical protein